MILLYIIYWISIIYLLTIIMNERQQEKVNNLDRELKRVTEFIALSIKTGLGYSEAMEQKKEVIKKYISFILKLKKNDG